MPSAPVEMLPPPSARDAILNEIVRRLVEVYHPERIYLFGSAARGDADSDSDYDLMVILPDEAPQHLRGGNSGIGLFVELGWLRMCRFGPGVISTGSCI